MFPQTSRERGISLEAQAEKIRAMALVQGAELGRDHRRKRRVRQEPEPARHGQAAGMVDAGKVKAVIVAKLDRLTRSVKDLCELLERFERRGVALVSVAESLDTGSAAGRLVLNIMAAVSQWEREAIGERTRDALRHKRSQGERVGNIAFGFRLAGDGQHVEPDPAEQGRSGGDPAAAPRRGDPARDRRRPEPQRVPDAAGDAVAAGVSGPSPQAAAHTNQGMMESLPMDDSLPSDALFPLAGRIRADR